MLTKVISGAQTGADIAALRAARRCKLETGGFITNDAKSLIGTIPQFTIDLYKLEKVPYKTYPFRTRENVKQSDGTIRIAHDFRSYGELCTLKYIRLYNKPFLDITLSKEFYANHQVGYTWEVDTLPSHTAIWIRQNGIETLNVAGNSDQEIEGIIADYLARVFTIVPEL